MFSDYSRKYPNSDFEGLRSIPDQLPMATLDRPEKLLPVTLDEAGILEDDPICALIIHGDNPDRPIGTENAAYPSRSEVVFKVSVGLLRRGFPPELVAGLLLNAAYKISASVREKRNPGSYAWRQVQRAATAAMEGWFDVKKNGAPSASYRNAYLCLLRLGVDTRYDLFRLRIIANGRPIQEFSGDMSDDIVVVLRKLATDKFDFDPGKTNVADAAHTLALENAFHPVRDYLDSLIWDGVERLPTLLSVYFGAEDTPLHSAFSVMTLVAAVRRVRKPGTKFDTMLVLEGKQGSGKSTAIKVLAGEDKFSDQGIVGLDQKTQGELLQGVWLFEIAELAGLRHTDTNDLKSFLSRDTDRFRAAYARFTTSYPRQCVFIGTTNDETYLKDVTGNRRIWPVKTTEIDLEGLRRDRDQLWAEAARLEADGAPITLPEELWQDASQVQNERMLDDPWLDTLARVEGQMRDGVERVATETLFGELYLKIPAGQRKTFHPKRIAMLMPKLGWEGPKKVRVTSGSKPVRGYERPTDQPDTPNY